MAQERASIGEQEDNQRHMPRGWMLTPLALTIIAAIVGIKRQDRQPSEGPPWRPWIPLANRVDHTIGWDRLPWPVGLPVVVTFLRQLRRENLYDPSSITATIANPPVTPVGTRHMTARTVDGMF